MKMAHGLILAVALVLFAQPARAQTQTPAAQPTATTQINFTAHDVAQLLKATRDAQTSPDIVISVLAKNQGEMPSYDPLVHYAGIDPSTHHSIIWMMKSIAKDQPSANALMAAMELACMDSGFAGAQWKSIYDQVSQADGNLPQSQPNRYFNRLRLTQQIQSIVDSYAHHK